MNPYSNLQEKQVRMAWVVVLDVYNVNLKLSITMYVAVGVIRECMRDFHDGVGWRKGKRPACPDDKQGVVESR